jgi:glucose dehydrogenase
MPETIQFLEYIPLDCGIIDVSASALENCSILVSLSIGVWLSGAHVGVIGTVLAYAVDIDKSLVDMNTLVGMEGLRETVPLGADASPMHRHSTPFLEYDTPLMNPYEQVGSKAQGISDAFHVALGSVG